MPLKMTDERLAKFRLGLRERHTACLKEMRQKLQSTYNEHYMDLVGSVHDVADESVADLLADLGILELDRLAQESADIDSALLRFAHGTYGVCTDCGNAVAVERLVAYPTVQRCQPCQVRYENSHAVAGHASI